MKQFRSHHTSKDKLQQLKSKMSTIKMGKTQRANSFLADPASFRTEEPQPEETQADVEPWLQEYEATEPVLKQERAIRNEINALLAAQGAPNREGSSLEVEKVDSGLITKKMKKYQPANSSFSLFYGEKKGLQKLKGDELSSQNSSRLSKHHFKLPVLPIKRSSRQLAAIREHKQAKRAFLSHNSLSKPTTEHLDILNQLKSIQREGEGLTNFSSRLIHRIDRATEIVDMKFQLLNRITEEMTADVGSYRLQQETDGSYKSQEYITPPRLLKK